MLMREVNDHETAAPDAGDERLGHAEHGVRGDRSVDGVAPLAKNLDAGAGRVRIDACDRPTGANSHRLLRRLGRRRGLDAACHERDESGEQRADETDAHEVLLPLVARCQTRRRGRCTA